MRKLNCGNFQGSGGGGGRGGVQARPPENSLDTFFCPQLILQLTEGVQWFYYREDNTFPRTQRGYNIFQGGPTFSLGGGRGLNANFYRNPYDL